MHVICLEGCHGVGKTTVIEDLNSKGYTVLDELFIDMPRFDALHPQTITMESIWVSNWFRRLLQIQQDAKNSGKDTSRIILFADRSPYSALYYSKCSPEVCSALELLIRSQIQELRSSGICIYTVLINVDKDLLWSRILKRLEREPERSNFNEDKRWWMEKTYEWYSNFKWDYVISNNDSMEKVKKVNGGSFASILNPCLYEISRQDRIQIDL